MKKIFVSVNGNIVTKVSNEYASYDVIDQNQSELADIIDDALATARAMLLDQPAGVASLDLSVRMAQAEDEIHVTVISKTELYF